MSPKQAKNGNKQPPPPQQQPQHQEWYQQCSNNNSKKNNGHNNKNMNNNGGQGDDEDSRGNDGQGDMMEWAIALHGMYKSIFQLKSHSCVSIIIQSFV